MARVICIDAETKRVYEDELPTGDTLPFLQKKVGGMIELAGGIEGFNADVFVNEEGLLEGLDYGFLMPGVGQGWFAGNAVVAGVNDEGETIGTDVSVAQVNNRVFWIEGEMRL